ncbi:MAG: BOW99_gp33 family protein [Streptococcus sp.]
MKTKWEPTIINIMANGSRVDDLTKYTIQRGIATTISWQVSTRKEHKDEIYLSHDKNYTCMNNEF